MFVGVDHAIALLELGIFVDFDGGFGLFSSHNNHNLASRSVLGEIVHQLGKRAIVCGVVQLGDFAAHRGIAVGAKCFGKLLERAQQAQRRFIENQGAFLGGKRSELGGTAFFLRKEALEAKTVARQT